jgi:CheY-like chemotaxis protein
VRSSPCRSLPFRISVSACQHEFAASPKDLPLGWVVLGVMARPPGLARAKGRSLGSGPWKISIDPATGERHLPRLLIVDDSEGSREVYSWCFRAAGWAVVAVQSREALFAAAHYEPNIIVVVLRVPARGSLSAIRLLQAHERTMRIPTIVCSGHEGSEEPFARLGVECFSPEQLREVFKQILADSCDWSARAEPAVREENEEEGPSHGAG